MVSSSGGRGAGEIGGFGGGGHWRENARDNGKLTDCQWEMDVWKKKGGEKYLDMFVQLKPGRLDVFFPVYLHLLYALYWRPYDMFVVVFF